MWGLVKAGPPPEAFEPPGASAARRHWNVGVTKVLGKDAEASGLSMSKSTHRLSMSR